MRFTFLHAADLHIDSPLESLGGKASTWGGGDLQDTGELRKAYITTLKKADANEIDDLLAFARS